MKAGRPVTAESFRPLELKSQSYFWAMGLGAATWLRLSRQPELSSRGCVPWAEKGTTNARFFLIPSRRRAVSDGGLCHHLHDCCHGSFRGGQSL